MFPCLEAKGNLVPVFLNDFACKMVSNWKKFARIPRENVSFVAAAFNGFAIVPRALVIRDFC